MGATDDSEWFYAEGGKSVGPFSKQALVAKWQNGEIHDDTPVCQRGSPQWIRAGDTEIARAETTKEAPAGLRLKKREQEEEFVVKAGAEQKPSQPAESRPAVSPPVNEATQPAPKEKKKKGPKAPRVVCFELGFAIFAAVQIIWFVSRAPSLWPIYFVLTGWLLVNAAVITIWVRAYMRNIFWGLALHLIPFLSFFLAAWLGTKEPQAGLLFFDNAALILTGLANFIDPSVFLIPAAISVIVYLLFAAFNFAFMWRSILLFVASLVILIAPFIHFRQHYPEVVESMRLASDAATESEKQQADARTATALSEALKEMILTKPAEEEANP